MLKALHGELDALLRTLPGKAVSASKIRSVAKACFDLRVEYKRAVHAIERFVSKAPPHCKLGGIYVVDAVCRRSRAQLGDKDVFSPRFASCFRARLSASFTPNAMAFSSAMPMAVGTAPFQKALTPSSDEVLATVLKIPE